MEANTERASDAATSSGRSPRRYGRNTRPRDPPDPLRVIVTGYPPYSQPQDLARVFTKFGQVNVDKLTPKYAVLSFANKEQALEAVKASDKVNVYGEFLVVKQYTDNRASEIKKSSPKRDFTRSKQKDSIIEPKDIDLSGTFAEQLERVLAAVRLTQEEVAALSSLYTDVERALQPQWPGCTAIPFGSITTGLGVKSSDADCFVLIPPQYRHPHVNYVNKAKRLLELHPKVFAEILSIPRANTPIVKFFHIPTGTDCDLTFKTPLGAQNSKLIAVLLHSDPRLVPLAVAVKYWARAHELSGTGKLTNYALTLLLVFYLQQPPLRALPPVCDLQRDRARDLVVDSWNAGFDPDALAARPRAPPASLLDLLGGFFRFYAQFDFDECAVCPYVGLPLRKEAFRDAGLLPPEYETYGGNVARGVAPPLRCGTPLVVQDPFEQCHNVASAVSARHAALLRAHFRFAADAAQAAAGGGPAAARFLPTVLLHAPKLARAETHPEYRVNLVPRVPVPVAGPAWKRLVRDSVFVIFEDMLKIELARVEEKPNPASRKEKERYAGAVTRAIWRRKRFSRPSGAIDLGFREKQARITDEIARLDRQVLNVEFQLLMTFRSEPRSAAVAIRLCAGDAVAFREFGKFFVSVMQSWFAILLKTPARPAGEDEDPIRTLDSNVKALDLASEDEEVPAVPAVPASSVEVRSGPET
ncbi:unnamed protein product [Diatraea saccharalis]|uniref:Speckle targeted PIP5K1A-regulated poly(A) polymerase n=1 Tax=Diatraea saccharalis TaxID=40085 RepID=A0A9N9R325_9NEOP|nr:unnamed protein product [Diatraea saccharalis]